MAETILGVAAAYLGLGLIMAVGFVAVGVGRVDPAAKRGTLGFRLLILPGAVALWPLVALKWARNWTPGGRP